MTDTPERRHHMDTDAYKTLRAALDEVEATTDPGDLLQTLRCLESTIVVTKREAVEQMRARGDSWATIAYALDMSRQGAWERFGQDEAR